MEAVMLNKGESGGVRFLLALAMLFVNLFLATSTNSQPEILCGVPDPTPEEMARLKKQVEARLQERRRETVEIKTIPVAVHIVHRSDGSGNVTDQQVINQIAVLNIGFENTNFRFSLCGIDRVANDEWAEVVYGSQEEDAMKQTLAIDPQYMLNFYVCAQPRDPEGPVYGWGTFPWLWELDPYMHGVVVKFTSLPGGSDPNFNQGDWGVHEVGHYVGLWHTFQGGCTSPGDEVDDTPPHQQNIGCPTTIATCNPNVQDPIHNFMNYTYDNCRYEFTAGQADRTDDQMGVWRQLVFKSVCVQVEQKLENGTRIGDVGRWNGSSFNPRFAPGRHLAFSELASPEVLHGDTNMASNQKYLWWVRQLTPDPDVRNHHRFDIEDMSFPPLLTSQFIPAQSNIVIKTDLLDAPGTTGGNIQFKDPWYIDFTDPDYGNTRRNRGHTGAVPHTRSVGSTGFRPDYSTLYPEGPYRGVFLGQSEPTGPHYSVIAIAQQTLGNFTSYYQKWSGFSATFQDSFALQTPVVFTHSGATATARYKANLGSSLSSATSSNSQRKLVFQVDGGAALLYESAGEIWMSSATTLSGTYGAEYRVSDNTGGFAFPSVAVSVGDFYSVYRRQSGSSYTVLFREKREGVWQAQQQVNTTAITSVNTKPVVTRTNAQWNGAGPWSRPRLLFAWQGNSGLKYREVWQVSQTNTGWDWSGAEQTLTGSNYYNPSLSTAYLAGSMPTVYITYDNGSNVYLRPYTGSLGVQETVPGSLAPIAFGSQVTADTRISGTHIVNVVWETAQIENPTSPEMTGIHTVMHQQKTDTGGWGAASQFQSQIGAISYYRPTITNLSNGKLIMSWDDGTNQYRATNVNGVWTVDSRVQASLRHSNLAAGGTNGPLTTARIVATNASGPPHRLNLSSVFTEADDGPTIRVEYSRRVEMVRSKRSGEKDEPDTLAVLSVDLNEIILKNADGTETPVQFVNVNNGNPGLDDDNA